MSEQVLSKFRVFFFTVGQLAGPLFVFIIAFLHHHYFQDATISSLFAAAALFSLILVSSFDKMGLYIAAGLQLAFVAFVHLQSPIDLWHQLCFSLSLMLTLFATYYAECEVIEEPVKATSEVTDEKVRLWQELFNARQEIKSLYQQKQEQEAEIALKIGAISREKEQEALLLKHHLEALLVDKLQIVKQLEEAEADIRRLIGHMQEMAEANAELKKKIEEAPTGETLLSPDALYRQLRLQFEEKSRVLDETRKELFMAQEKVEVLHRQVNDLNGPTDDEKRLVALLKEAELKMDALQKAHDEELIGHEEVIKGLLIQLHEKTT